MCIHFDYQIQRQLGVNTGDKRDRRNRLLRLRVQYIAFISVQVIIDTRGQRCREFGLFLSAGKAKCILGYATASYSSTPTPSSVVPVPSVCCHSSQGQRAWLLFLFCPFWV